MMGTPYRREGKLATSPIKLDIVFTECKQYCWADMKSSDMKFGLGGFSFEIGVRCQPPKE